MRAQDLRIFAENYAYSDVGELFKHVNPSGKFEEGTSQIWGGDDLDLPRNGGRLEQSVNFVRRSLLDESFTSSITHLYGLLVQKKDY
jgi:hypothetical protein